MKKKIIMILSIICIGLCLSSCNENENDQIEIYNKDSAIFDNISIPIKQGYFYERHEKFTVDENRVGVTVYFSNSEEDEWDNKPTE